LGHQWPALPLYAFPPIPLLQQVLCRIAHESREVRLIAPHWPSQPWAADLFNMSVQQPWELPVRRDLLTQAHRTVWHPHPEWCRLIASGLSDAVVATIQSARAVSTQALYTLKWRSFERWCAACQHDPINCADPVVSLKTALLLACCLIRAVFRSPGEVACAL